MWKPVSFLFFLLLAARAGETPAREVVNRVIVEHGALVVDHSRSVAEITQAQAKGGFPAEYGLGLFQSRIKTELAIDPGGSGGVSKRLTMTTRIRTSPIIYIAREFPEGSCAYGVILAHERLHQLFDLEVLRVLPGEIGAITRDVFQADELERAGARSLESSKGRFFQQFKFVYDGLSNPRHQTIDNPESYRLLGTQCHGEIAKRLTGDKQGAMAK